MHIVGFVIRMVYLFLPSILGTELLGYLLGYLLRYHMGYLLGYVLGFILGYLLGYLLGYVLGYFLGHLPRILEFLFSVTRCLRFGKKEKENNLSSVDSSRGTLFRRFREIAKSDC